MGKEKLILVPINLYFDLDWLVCLSRFLIRTLPPQIAYEAVVFLRKGLLNEFLCRCS